MSPYRDAHGFEKAVLNFDPFRFVCLLFVLQVAAPTQNQTFLNLFQTLGRGRHTTIGRGEPYCRSQFLKNAKNK